MLLSEGGKVAAVIEGSLLIGVFSHYLFKDVVTWIWSIHASSTTEKICSRIPLESWEAYLYPHLAYGLRTPPKWVEANPTRAPQDSLAHLASSASAWAHSYVWVLGIS